MSAAGLSTEHGHSHDRQRRRLHGGAGVREPVVGSIKKLLGDKAYDSNSFRKSLWKDGIT
jgi:hypothetical protein